MMALLALWRAGGLSKYAIMGAVGALLFVSGLALGNIWATDSYVEKIQKHDDEQFAKYTNQLAEDLKAQRIKDETTLATHLQRDRDATTHAFATLTKVKDEARRSASLVLPQLAKETHDVPPNCPAYTWSPDARSVLDRAASARDPAPDSSIINTIAPAPGGLTASGRAAVSPARETR